MAESSSLSLLGSQWRLSRIQLINWGTFDGYNDLRIRTEDGDGHPSVVCITGRSGTGKSTLFDAGTVLMMPYGRTLNAASNLGRGGSPREVRTYLRGMVNTVADERGRARGKYLRDETATVYSAIVHTWEDMLGSVFSAARFFLLRPGGGEGDLAQTLVTYEGQLDPRALRPYASSRLQSRDVVSVYPGCTVHDRTGNFLRTIYLTLGIGSDGNGTNAMKLMYRIQSGIPMTNVDDLFKELVLDPPSTFEVAQAVVESFDQNQNVWRKIDEARRKREMLTGIDESHRRLSEAREAMRLVESLAHLESDGPFKLWLERHRLSLATSELASTRSALSRNETSRMATAERRAHHEEELEKLSASIYERGGGNVERLQAEAAAVSQQREQALRKRQGIERLLQAAARELPDSQEAWDDLVVWSNELLDVVEARAEQLQKEVDEVGVELQVKQRELDEHRRDLEYYRSHRTNITRAMAEAREKMAKAAGLDPSDIPFAAELMDVPREQGLWRTAVNISLAHVADRILVEKSFEASFRRAIDPLASELGRRYHFDFVDLEKEYLSTPQAGHVSSKVVYREDSPFKPYVEHLVCTSTDHLCVDTVGKLAGQGPRITPSGQERRGNRGAIGHSRSTLIIGFSNEMLIEDLEAEVANFEEDIRQLRLTHRNLKNQQHRLDAEKTLANQIMTVSWEEIDVASFEERLVEIRSDLKRLEQDDELKALREMRDRLKSLAEQEVGELRLLDEEIKGLQRRISDFDLMTEQCRLVIEGIESLGVTITDEQAALAEDACRQTETALANRSAILDSFARVEGQARQYLDALLRSKGEEQARCVRQLENTFVSFHATFMADDTEHGTQVEEYPFYHTVLAELERERLDEPEIAWEEGMLRDVACGLSRLSDAFTKEERAIDERLRPVNDILCQFVFGERRGRLGVVSERRTLSDVTTFRRRLRSLSALATRYDFAGGEAEVRREHRNLESFVNTLRDDLASTGKGARHYLDTRHMVRISARETVPADPEATPIVYDSINGKSGGQYQELVAFILGAALLYCLGQNAATKPSYAPLYLDEAFIKADSDHTRRALGALSGLGFQVVIAVPDGKVEAVAPLASQIVSLSKDPRTDTTRTRSLLRAGTNENGEALWED